MLTCEIKWLKKYEMITGSRKFLHIIYHLLHDFLNTKEHVLKFGREKSASQLHEFNQWSRKFRSTKLGVIRAGLVINIMLLDSPDKFILGTFLYKLNKNSI